MRQIVLDTETTGLDWKTGDRVIEIGCIELLNRSVSSRHYHVFINPEREIPQEAINIHGIDNEFIADKPVFSGIAAEFVDFIQDAELIIHNASFDVGFLNNELSLLNLPPINQLCTEVIDTLKMARALFPGKRASLDALCDRYDIANAHRVLHGALLDAQLLAEVYLAMTRGQESLQIQLEEDLSVFKKTQQLLNSSTGRPLKIIKANPQELEQHQANLLDIKQKSGKCLWLEEDFNQ